MRLIAQVEVNVDDSEVAKLNAKRQRLGRQTRTAEDELENALSEALMTNFLFDPIEVKVRPAEKK